MQSQRLSVPGQQGADLRRCDKHGQCQRSLVHIDQSIVTTRAGYSTCTAIFVGNHACGSGARSQAPGTSGTGGASGTGAAGRTRRHRQGQRGTGAAASGSGRASGTGAAGRTGRTGRTGGSGAAGGTGGASAGPVER